MVRAAERSPRGRALSALVPVLLLVLALLVGTPTAAGAAPSAGGGGGGTLLYTGELTPEQLGLVMASGIDRHEIQTSPGAATGSVLVEVVLGQGTADSLIAQGVPLEPRATAARTAATSDGVFRPWSGSDGLRVAFTAMARANPTLVKQVTIGRSVQGQEILAFKVTANAPSVPDGSRPSVLYISAQHAREWITPEMTRRLMQHVLNSYRTNNAQIRQLLAGTELWFVPVVNPDGYDYTFTDDRLWRKNLADNDGDGQITFADGVDLNRNYPTHWGYDEEGSSSLPESDTYRGPRPRSEPETRAVDDLMRRIDFEFLVNYHSAAELLLYGAGWQVATPTPDDVLYEVMAGNDANPAVPGYDPDISAELYTTNGDTDDHATEAYGTLAFTPEMSTCETASAVNPDDDFEPEDCGSVFEFPDSEALVQAEFEKNIPFALAVARSAQSPSTPVSVVGRTAPNFVLDPFTVSYGSPQPVAVTARRDLQRLELHYRIAGGPEQRSSVQEWAGGERYGDDGDVYYAEFRGTVRGARAGQKVEVWFTGFRPGTGNVASSRFTYTLARTGGQVLVLANEDYEGWENSGPDPANAPRYAQQYVTALNGAGYSTAVWDVSKQGVPHDLGVLSHFRSIIWYLGNNRLTQDREDVLTETFFAGDLEDASVAERQQYLTIAVRDYLNAGGSLALTGETAAYYGQLGTAIGGIYYGLDGAPQRQCMVTADPFSDCLLLADDFTQYYLGAYNRAPRSDPTTLEGVGPPIPSSTPLAGTPSNAMDEVGTFVPTSAVLPESEFPQFASEVAGVYAGGSPSNLETFEGDWFAAARHADNSYMRLARTINLTGVGAAQNPRLEFALSYDVEEGYDNVIVEAAPAGTQNWTTLPIAGLTDQEPPTECEGEFLLDLHPFLEHYLTQDDPCTTPGSTGSWNRVTGTSDGWVEVGVSLSGFAGAPVQVAISYVTDPFTGGAGVFVDRTRVVIGGTVTEQQGFETGLAPWTTPGAPAGSPANSGDFERSQSEVGAVITTDDTVLLGFGIEQVPGATARRSLLGAIVGSLLAGP